MIRVQVRHLLILDLELLLRVPNDSGDVDREMDVVIILSLENNMSEIISILLELIELILETHLHVRVIGDLLGDLGVQRRG